MSGLLLKIKRNYLNELPLIRLYMILYMIGIFIGVIGAVVLNGSLTSDVGSIFSPRNSCGFFIAFFKQFVSFLLLYFLGLTVIGIPVLPLYPLYKGFSLGIIIALAVIFTGVHGFFFGTLAFFAQNLFYTALGYFLCYSSARLSVALIESLRGTGKHGAAYKEFLRHTYRFLIILPFLALGAIWEWKVVPLILSLF